MLLDRRPLRDILDETSVASKGPETQTISEIPPVAPSIKVRATCSGGYYSVDSNLTTGTVSGGRSWTLYTLGTLYEIVRFIEMHPKMIKGYVLYLFGG